MPVARQEMPHAVIAGEIYVVGGLLQDRTATTLVQVYNPASGKWRELAPMPFPMHHLGMAVVGEKLYVVGGYLDPTGRFSASDRVFEYDPVTDVWAEKARKPSLSGAHTAVAFRDRIYVFGGARFGPQPSVDIYHPATDTWTTGAPMPTAREHLSAALVDSLIYVVGGRVIGGGNTAAFEAYSPLSDSWRALAALPTPRGGLMAASANGKVYVLGGEFPGVFPENEEYDPTTNTWRSVAPMSVPRHGAGTAVVGDTIFVIGGGPVAGFGTTDFNGGFVIPRDVQTDVAAESPPSTSTVSRYPNPASDVVRFDIVLSRGSQVNLQLVDVLGRVVETRSEGLLVAGSHSFLLPLAGLSAGPYFYRITIGSEVLSGSILIAR